MQRKWATFAVLLTVLVLGSVLLAISGGDGDEASSLKVEQTVSPDGRPELLITVPTKLNVPETVSGRALVELVCSDDGGETVVRSRHPWPVVSDGEPPAPHIHQATSTQEIASIARCRLEDTSPALEGRLGLPR